MKFRTEITIPTAKDKINHQDAIMSVGSCFADNIAEYLKEYKFKVSANPFGVLYNPKSVLSSIRLLCDPGSFDESALVFRQSEYHSFYHHSDFSHHEREFCLNRIKDSLSFDSDFLRRTEFLIITFGTALIYRHKASGMIVSNCHKIPPGEFIRERLSVQETSDTIREIIDTARNFNSSVKFIFTVSPVRHLRDGATENLRSKSILISALHDVLDSAPDCLYFPSYELITDELRDYRFYAEDMLHPNKIAVDFVWQKFCETLFTGECLDAVNKIKTMRASYKHRVRNPESESHKAFLTAQLENLKHLKAEYPYADFRQEESYFSGERIK